MNSPTGYTIDDLLDLVVTEKAKGLSLHAGHPPVVSVRDEAYAIEGPDISSQNADELLRSLATTRQIRELRDRGRIEFLHDFQGQAQFKVLVKSSEDEFQIDLERMMAA